MNFNDILSNVIAGLICAILIAICSYLFRCLKKSYFKAKFLFIIKTCLGISFFIIFIAIIYFDKETFMHNFLSSQNFFNLWLIACVIFNIRNIIDFTDSMIRYYYYDYSDDSQNNNK